VGHSRAPLLSAASTGGTSDTRDEAAAGGRQRIGFDLPIEVGGAWFVLDLVADVSFALDRPGPPGAVKRP
jgi:hypothetical protein